MYRQNDDHVAVHTAKMMIMWRYTPPEYDPVAVPTAKMICGGM
jgi:hypothetical protein